MARAVGLDIGAKTIKVVDLGGSPKSLKIQRLAVRDVPTPPLDADAADEWNREEATAEVIRELFDSLGLNRDDVCTCFDSGVTIFREITVPFLEEDQIRKVVRFEAENHLHSHNIEDVVINWIKVGESRDGSRLIIFASPKEELARHLSTLRMAGIEPASIDLDATANYTTLQTIGFFDENPNVIVMDVGAHSTSLMLIADGKPRVMRSFLMGIGSGDAAIDALPAGAPRADDLLVPAAQLEGAEAGAATQVLERKRTDFVTKLHREAIRSLASVRTEEPPTEIVLLGGGSLLPDLPERLGERFGLPARTFDLFDQISCKDPGTSPEYSAVAVGPAVGCGLRMMGKSGLGLELLQDEFAPKNVFDVVKTALTTAITLAFLAILAWTFVHKQKLEAEQRKFAANAYKAEQMLLRVEPAFQQEVRNLPKTEAESAALQLVRARLPKNHKRIQRILQHLRMRHRELQDELGLARDVPRLPSALETMVNVYEALSTVDRAELGAHFEIKKMDIREKRMTMTFYLSDVNTADVIRKLLDENEFLQERSEDPRSVVLMGSRSRMRSGLYKQDIEIKFKDPTDIRAGRR